MTELAFITAPNPIHSDDTLDHLYCCDENLALCGADLTNVPYMEDTSPEDECVVCYTLDDEHPDSTCKDCTP